MFVSCFIQEYHTIGANIWHLSTLPVVRSNQWHLSSDSSNCHTHAWPLQIVPMRSDLFSSLNKVKHVCKQIQRHVYILDTTSLTRHGRTIKNLEWWLGTSDVKRGFPFFLHVWHFCVKSKNSLEPRFQPTSQFPPKNTYHMHTGLFFSTCVTIICVTYPKNILQPHFHGSSHLKKLPFAQRTFLFFMCDYYLHDIPKKKNILQPRFHAGPTDPLYYWEQWFSTICVIVFNCFDISIRLVTVA